MRAHGGVSRPGKRRTGGAKTRCGNTTKRRYRDADEALAALRAVKEIFEPERTAKRFYECPYCNGYHLTSREHGY